MSELKPFTSRELEKKLTANDEDLNRAFDASIDLVLTNMQPFVQAADYAKEKLPGKSTLIVREREKLNDTVK